VIRVKSPEEVEKELFKAWNFEPKKISLNLNRKTLDNVDELAKIIGITRTSMIELLCRTGVVEQIEVMQKTYEKMLKMKECEEKKNIINQRLKSLKEFEKKVKI